MKWVHLFGLATLLAIAPPALANDQEQLHQLLDDFLANSVKDDLKNHERFWATDLIYTSSAGTRFGKKTIIQGIQEESNTQQEETSSPTYSAEDTQIRLYGTTAIVAFKLVAKSTENHVDTTQHYLNTGTFLKRNGIWQAVAWQATKIPSPQAAP